jgi:hypothetical protein
MLRGKLKKNKGNSTANLGFEAKLWAAADALRNNMDAAEYKRVVHISDVFEARRPPEDVLSENCAGPGPRERRSTIRSRAAASSTPIVIRLEGDLRCRFGISGNWGGRRYRAYAVRAPWPTIIVSSIAEIFQNFGLV